MESSAKKITVDEGGNKRQEITAEDIKQAINDVEQWFKTHAPAYYTNNLEGNRGLSELEVDNFLKAKGA